MNIISERCTFCKPLETKHRFLLVVILFIFFVAGCGEEDFAPDHYNPVSPLPLRINVTPTPIIAASPSENEPEAAEETPFPQSTSTPVFEQEQSQITPTPGAKKKREETTPTIEETPTPGPALPPRVATPAPEPPKTKATPSPTPTSTPTPKAAEPTPTPEKTAVNQTEEATQDKTAANKTKASKNPPETPKKASDGSAPDNQNKSKGTGATFTAIVTPEGFSIDKFAVCAKISNRNPVNCGNTFSLSETGKVFTWIRVSGVKPTQAIKHIYYWEDAVVATVKLPLKYTSMRTWSQKTFKPKHTGNWKVVIATEENEVIFEQAFTVTP